MKRTTAAPPVRVLDNNPRDADVPKGEPYVYFSLQKEERFLLEEDETKFFEDRNYVFLLTGGGGDYANKVVMELNLKNLYDLRQSLNEAIEFAEQKRKRYKLVKVPVEELAV